MSQDLVGKKYTFQDGNVIEIIQVKDRDDGPWVTYITYVGKSVPRKLTMKLGEFTGQLGHLFGLKDAPPKRL